jgi:hypothetical protein
MLMVPLNASAATVRMSDLHISMELPTGWTYERNASSGGIIYDCEIEGPLSGGFQPYGLLDHMDWPGSVSNSALWAELESEIDDVREDPDFTYSAIVSVPTNGTINGVKSCDMTMDMTTSGVTMRGRMVVIASDSWNMGWKLFIATVSTEWSTHSAQINSIFVSLTVSEKEETDISMVLIGGIVLAVVVVIIVVAVVMMRARDKREEQNALQPPIQPPLQPPMQPPPPPNQ